MHKEISVINLEIDDYTSGIMSTDKIISYRHLPIFINVKNNTIDKNKLNDWWGSRSIPASREGLRILLETFNITSPKALLTKCYGLSLSDQYWIRPINSSLKWKDINFFDNPFSDDIGNILFGDNLKNKKLNAMSPDTTAEGVQKKKWFIDNNIRKLLKGGSGPYRQEPYNEVLASAIMRRLDIPHIDYKLTHIEDYPYCICDNFITKDTDLIPAWQIINKTQMLSKDTFYSHYINSCDSINIPNPIEITNKMLTVDYIIANRDRHYSNFGAIRNANTLEFIGIAPIFDSGTSLWNNEPTQLIKLRIKKDEENKEAFPFTKKHSTQIKLVSSFDWYNSKKLLGIDEEFMEILKDSITIDKKRKETLCKELLNRIKSLENYIDKHKQRETHS